MFSFQDSLGSLYFWDIIIYIFDDTFESVKTISELRLFLECTQKRKCGTLPLGDIINEEVIDRELLHYTICHITKSLAKVYFGMKRKKTL